MAFPTNMLGILIALVSAFALVHSADSIPRLLKYEDKAKKAAEWSRTAEKQLWEIRYTVGTGFVGVRPAPSLTSLLPLPLTHSLTLTLTLTLILTLTLTLHQNHGILTPHLPQCLVSAIGGIAFSLVVPRGLGIFTVGFPIMLAAGLTYGHQYMRQFWASKPKVPMMKDFNEAISDSMMVQDMMNPLAGAWGLMTFCKLVGL